MRSTAREWVSRCVATLRRSRRDADLAEEIGAHVAELTNEHLRRGLALHDARAAARREFGGVEQVKESYRDQQGVPLIDTLVQDIRYAWRSFRKSPGFVCAVVLSLGAGVGANAVVFTVLNAVLLTSLPVRHPNELVVVAPQTTAASGDLSAARFSYQAFDLFRRVAPVPQSLAGMSRVARMYRRDGDRHDLQLTRVQLVSGEFFRVLGVSAVQGRVLLPQDDQPTDPHPFAVMSHSMWSRTFGADPAIVGRTFTINGRELTVVGVAPPGFSGVWLEAPADLWIPITLQSDVRYRQNYSASNSEPLKSWIPQDGIRWINVVGRVTAADRDRTSAAIATEFHRLVSGQAEHLGDPAQRERLLQQRVVLRPFGQGFSIVRTNFALPLYVLLGMTALILLIACANAANLLLARATVRRREIAVRLSLGASRARIVRQLLTETALLAALAGACGLLLAVWLPDLLVQTALADVSPFRVAVDVRVVAFSVGAALSTLILSGLAPAFRTTRVPPGIALRATTARGAGAQPRVQRLLVACQVAFSLVLLVSAGLFVRTLRNYADVDLGFSQEHVLTASLNLTAAGYSPDRIPALSHALIDRLAALPGVTSASAAACGLADGCRSVSDITIDGYQPAPGEAVQVQENRVSPDYFATTGMRVTEGRAFTSADREGSQKVAIVNRAMARQYFGNRSALGRRFWYGPLTASARRDAFVIVGVVEDARVNRVQQAAVPMAFYPMDQFADLGVVDVRTAADPRASLADLRRTIVDVAPDVPIVSVSVLSDRVARNLSQQRLLAVLTTAFGVLAAALAAFGLFGVMSYGVVQRTSEFGIRMALGAPRTTVLAHVLRDAATIVAVGLVVGVPIVLAASRLLTAMLFGVAATDPATLGASVATLLAVAILSASVPAWRASRVDPAVALRQE